MMKRSMNKKRKHNKLKSKKRDPKNWRKNYVNKKGSLLNKEEEKKN